MKPQQHITNFIKNFFTLKFSNKLSLLDLKQIVQKWYAPSKPIKQSIEPIITWIGQATFLIQIDGINILTDPIFYDISYFFPRLVPAGIAPEHLPTIDVLLISHDHRDHMEKQSLLRLIPHNPMILAPHGLGKRLARWGFKKIIEHYWGDKTTFTTPAGEKTTFTFLPAAHWAGCNIFNINKSMYGSWMIEHEAHTIYFGGDSSYANHFKEIGQDFSSIKTALLPISPIEPRHLVEHAHLDGKQAIQAFLDLKAKQFIPMHWGTFQFGTEKYEEPIIRLKEWWEKHKEHVVNKTLFILKFGQTQKLLLENLLPDAKSKLKSQKTSSQIAQ